MNKAYLSLGSNEGDRVQWMEKAMWLLTVKSGTIVNQSSVYETAAWGLNTQPDFLNMVIVLETTKNAHELLKDILEAETTLGRHRTVKWGPRTIDIDILFYDDEIIDTPELVVPHPYLQERRFILIPMAEIAPKLQHPKLQKTIAQLLEECEDELEVKKVM